MIRILVATDAWRPQVNGVVHTLERMSAAARELNAEFVFLTPQGFPSLPLPTYPDIRLALASPWEVARRIEAAGRVLGPALIVGLGGLIGLMMAGLLSGVSQLGQSALQ